MTSPTRQAVCLLRLVLGELVKLQKIGYRGLYEARSVPVWVRPGNLRGPLEARSERLELNSRRTDFSSIGATYNPCPVQSCFRVRITRDCPLAAAAQARLALMLMVRAKSAYSVNDIGDVC